MRVVIALFLISIAMSGYARSFAEAANSFLFSNRPLNYTASELNLKGNPCYVITYKGKLVSSWGDVSLQKGDVLSAFRFDRDGNIVAKYDGSETYVVEHSDGHVKQINRISGRLDLEKLGSDQYINTLRSSSSSPQIKYVYNWDVMEPLRIEIFKGSSTEMQRLIRYKSLSAEKVELDYFDNERAVPTTVKISSEDDRIHITSPRPYYFSNSDLAVATGNLNPYALYDGVESDGSLYYFELNEDSRAFSIASKKSDRGIVVCFDEAGDETGEAKYHLQYRDWVLDSNGTTVYQYEYDDNGNWTLRTAVRDEDTENPEYLIREIVYYDSSKYEGANKNGSAKKSGSDDKIYAAVEEQPQFPGGPGAMMKYLSSHINYPAEAAKNDIQGRVIVKFVVEKDGSLGEVNIVKGVDPYLNEEAIRVVKNMPKWIPGKNNGEIVSTWFTLPVTFKLTSK